MAKSKYRMLIKSGLVLFYLLITTNAQAQLDIDSLQKKLEKSRGLERIETLNKLAQEYRTVVPEKTLAFAYEALDLSQSAHYLKGIIDANRFIGAGYHHTGNIKKSMEYLEKSLSQALKENYKEAISFCYRYIGNCYSTLGNIPKSIEYNQKAIKVAEEAGYTEGIDLAMSNIGEFYASMGEKDKALEYYERALKLREKTGEKIKILWAWRDIANLYMNYNESDRAVDAFMNAFRIAGQMGDKASKASSLRYLGLIYDNWGNFQKAEENLKKSLEMFENTGKIFDIADANFYLGSFYEKNGHFEDAIKYLQTFINLSERAGTHYKTSRALMEIGNSLAYMGQFDKAMESLDKARQIAIETGDQLLLAWIYSNTANVYTAMKKIPESIEGYKTAIQIFDEMGTKLGAGSNHYRLAMAYAHFGDLDNALFHINKAIEIGKEIKYRDIADVYFNAYKIYYLKNDLRNAHDMLLQYTLLRDSLNKENNSRKISDLQMQFEMDKKESELLIKDLELGKQKYYTNLLIIGAVFILVIASILYIFYSSKRRNNKILEAKNAELEKANNAKESYLAIIDSELNKAANYVRSLLPARIKNGTIKTQWSFVPSSKLGGDSFGYHWIDDDHFAVYLLDVCCHGVEPALLSVSVLNVLRFQTLRETDFREPDQVLRGLNKAFQMKEHNNMYFTIWYGVFSKKENNLKYSSGGHPPAALIFPDGNYIKLHVQNYPVGGTKEFEYQSKSEKLNGHAKLYIFSDGAYEIYEPLDENWDIDNLCSFLASNQTDDEGDLAELYERARQINHGKSLDDDFSVLKIVYH